MRTTSSEKITRTRAVGVTRDDEVSAIANRTLPELLPATSADVKINAESDTFPGNKHPITKGACLFCRIRLTVICSYSYRVDSALDGFAICHCAETRKSPTIEQLRGTCLSFGDLAKLLHLMD